MQSYFRFVQCFSLCFAHTHIYDFIIIFNSDYAEKLSPKGVFYRVAGNGDFTASGNVVCIFIVVLVLLLFYIFTDENVSYIVRLKSRASFVTRRIADCAVFAFLFSFFYRSSQRSCGTHLL